MRMVTFFRSSLASSFIVVSAFFWLFIALLWGLNTSIFKFPGNNYLPTEALLIGNALTLILAGSYLQFGKQSRWFVGSKILSCYFFVMVTIACGTNVIQYTSQAPIDHFLLSIDKQMGVSLGSCMQWTMAHPLFKRLLIFAYNSLPYQMGWLPVMIIFLQGFEEVEEYIKLLLTTTLLGFIIYYCYPTLGPASIINSPHFYPEQLATGIKFKEIHQHLAPSTIDGGLIAFPSFHVTWACLCLYLVRRWKIIFFPILILNLLLIASCVLLGWHYLIDIFSSFLLLYLVYKGYKILNARHWKAFTNCKTRYANHIIFDKIR